MKRILIITFVCGITHLISAQNFGIGVSSPSEKLEVAGNSLVTGSTYIGSTDTRFYRDASNRIRTPDRFYVDGNSANTYLYSTNTYLGSSSGDAVHLRGNTFNWTSGSDGIINSSGNVGIGTQSPVQRLQVNGQIAINNNNTRIYEGGGNAVRFQTNYGYVDIGPQNTSWCHFVTDRGQFYFNKQIAINGNFYPYSNNSYWCGTSGNYWYGIYTRYIYGISYGTFSDRKLKTDISALRSSLPSIMKLNPVSYKYDFEKIFGCNGIDGNQDVSNVDGKDETFGFLAQELKDIFPELVKYHKEQGVYMVNIKGLIPVLAKAMQEQQKLIEAGQKEEERLKAKLEELKSQAYALKQN